MKRSLSVLSALMFSSFAYASGTQPVSCIVVSTAQNDHQDFELSTDSESEKTIEFADQMKLTCTYQPESSDAQRRRLENVTCRFAKNIENVATSSDGRLDISELLKLNLSARANSEVENWHSVSCWLAASSR